MLWSRSRSPIGKRSPRVESPGHPGLLKASREGYALLYRTGKASASRCLDVIMEEQELQNEKADTMLKGTGIAYLLSLPLAERKLVFKLIPIRAKRTTSRLAKAWANRAYESLRQNRLVF